MPSPSSHGRIVVVLLQVIILFPIAATVVLALQAVRAAPIQRTPQITEAALQ